MAVEKEMKRLLLPTHIPVLNITKVNNKISSTGRETLDQEFSFKHTIKT